MFAQAIVGILYATDESVDVLQIAQSAAEKMESKGSLPLGNVLRDSNLALSPLVSFPFVTLNRDIKRIG